MNQEQREAIIAEGIGVVDLWEASPIRFDDGESHTEEIIDALFPGNALLCVGTDVRNAETAPRESFRGRLSQYQHIVPSPMLALEGLTEEGYLSRRSKDNVGPRRYLVIEFDKGSTDEHAAILLHLAKEVPLAMVVHSGGKSLHGWVACQSASERQQEGLMRKVVILGADPATWTRCQFVRMPDATRDNGSRQWVVYLNLGVVK